MALRKVSGVEFVEVRVNPGCACAGKKLAEIKLPRSATVVSIERGGAVLIPDGGTEILPEDQLTIFCQTDLDKEVRMKFADRSDLTG
jgi:Trk K+ transport system NAD-binding subunit